MPGKHYKGQAYVTKSDAVEKICSIRLSKKELELLHEYFPDQTLSYAVRSCIHAYDKREKKLLE